MLGKGTVVEQLRIGGAADALYDLVVVMIVAMVVVGTIVPYSRKNLYPQDANWGPFNAFAEMLHGRLAMLGCVGLLYMENAHQMPMLDILMGR